MLNGVDPIILFHFKKKIPAPAASTVPSIPLLSNPFTTVDLIPIPIYLSERLTGLYIDTEDKAIEVDTQVDALPDGSDVITTQRPLTSTVKISMKASRESVGVTLLSAMIDLVFPKLTSKEYSITYIHGPVVVLNGLVHSFQINQNASDSLYSINIELINVVGAKKQAAPLVPGPITGATPLGAG